jgi:hypothetical protein
MIYAIFTTAGETTAGLDCARIQRTLCIKTEMKRTRASAHHVVLVVIKEHYF